MKKETLLIIGTMLLALPLAACNSQTVEARRHKQITKVIESNQRDATMMIGAILDAHKSSEPNKLATFVSKDFVPNKLNFVTRADFAAYGNKILDIDFAIMTIVGEKEEMIVKFKWDRTFIPKVSGSQAKDSGETIFVFKRNYRSRWVLQKVTGSDIFNYE